MEVAVVLFVLLPLVAVSDASSSPVWPRDIRIPIQYPLFKQCNSSWGSDVMENQTVCQVGCLMSSIAMALNHYNISIDGRPANPATLNQWLRNNGGYLSNDELIEEKVEDISKGHVRYTGREEGRDAFTRRELIAMLDYGVVTIANVLNGTHFVLMTGWDHVNKDTWAVNDPGYTRSVYSTNDIVGYRTFLMK